MADVAERAYAAHDFENDPEWVKLVQRLELSIASEAAIEKRKRKFFREFHVFSPFLLQH